jgi:hypothetical protein
MSGIWLTDDGAEEFEAIRSPTWRDDVELILDVLDADEPSRLALARRIQSLLDRQRTKAAACRRAVPVHRPHGLYVLLPWRLAKWLARRLSSPEAAVDAVRKKLESWLADDSAVSGDSSSSAKAGSRGKAGEP